MDITTPALLFPAISLLFLAYTNRFIVLAQLIRQLHGKEGKKYESVILRQIGNLKKRVFLIKLMQTFGVLSFICCALSMLGLFMDYEFSATLLFGGSLVCLVVSLVLSLYEITISMDAIHIELEDLKKPTGYTLTKKSMLE